MDLALNPVVAQEEIKRLIQQQLDSLVEHVCWTCYWCQFREGEHPRNRICRYPDMNHPDKQGRCAEWKLEPNPERRIKRFT